MYFNAFTVFALRYDAGREFNLDELHTNQKEQAFVPCRPTEAISVGWIPVGGDEAGEWTRNLNGATLGLLKIEERKVPASALKVAVNEKIREVLNTRREQGLENIDLSAGEIKEIRESVHDAMLRELPPSMSKFSQQWVYWDHQNSWLIVQGSSDKRAEVIAGYVRSASPCHTHFAATKYEPSEIMKEWLRAPHSPIHAASGAILGTSVSLKSEEKGSSKIVYKNQDLDDPHLRAYLDDENTVSEVAVIVPESGSFTLTDKFVFKGIKQDSERALTLKEDIKAMEGDALELAQIDAVFAAMVADFRASLTPMIEAFGGWDYAQAAALASPEPLDFDA